MREDAEQLMKGTSLDKVCSYFVKVNISSLLLPFVFLLGLLVDAGISLPDLQVEIH